MTGTIDRTPCPQCGLANNLYIAIEFVPSPLGTWSLAGLQWKTTGRELPVLRCKNCEFNLVGEYDGNNHAVFNPGRQFSDSPAPDTKDAPAHE
jgi:hypothetical protein